MAEERTKVLIVGGGPVGLALSIELGWRGIDNVLIDRRDGSIPLPKMNGVNARTMEFCRRWGIASRVRNAGWPEDFPVRIVYRTSMRGHEFFRFERGTALDRKPSMTTPEHFQRCPQTWFDPLLREFGAEMPTNRQHYETRLGALSQSDDGVLAELIDGKTGSVRWMSADYLVGCDGARSHVRNAMNIPADGEELLSQEVNIYFESDDVFADMPERRAAMIWLVGPQGMWAVVAAIDGRRIWRLWLSRVPIGTDINKLDKEALVRAAIGEGARFRVFGALPWARQRLVARSYRKGRIFLCGDAVHSHTPTGGFGMNLGIQDAVDLGWKISAVYEGWGGAGLLDSYEAERRPVAVRTADEATYTYGLLEDLPKLPALYADTAHGLQARQEMEQLLNRPQFSREYRNEGIVLGYRYEPSPICVPDGTPAPPYLVMNYEPNARPGARAPHVMLQDGRSTLDLFGRGFILMRLGKQPPGVYAMVAAASRRGVPLQVVDLEDAAVRDRYQRRLVLVRPDGHVAWRGDEAPEDALAVMDIVRGATPLQMISPAPVTYGLEPPKVSEF